MEYDYWIGRISLMIRRKPKHWWRGEERYSPSDREWVPSYISEKGWKIQIPITEEEALFLILSGMSTHDFIKTRTLSEV